MYIRIQAKRSTLQWSGCAKLAPRYCGPFEILARVGPVAYQLALPSHIRVHNVFHVSVLKKYVYDPKHVIRWQEIQVGDCYDNFSKNLYMGRKLIQGIVCCRLNRKERFWSNR